MIRVAKQMSDDAWRSLVSEGTRTGKLSTVLADGGPHVVPIWFLLDEDEVVFTAADDTVKAHNLLRDGRAAVCVDDERPPHAYVVLRGNVNISREPAALLTWATRIAARYMGQDRSREFGARNSVSGMLLVRMRIEHVTALAEIA